MLLAPRCRAACFVCRPLGRGPIASSHVPVSSGGLDIVLFFASSRLCELGRRPQLSWIRVIARGLPPLRSPALRVLHVCATAPACDPEVFNKTVYEDRNGKQVIVQKCSGGERVLDLAYESCKTRRAQCFFLLHSTGARIEVRTCVFIRSRPANSKLFWGLQELHRFLALTSFAGEPSRWICRSKASWGRSLQEFLDP